MTEDDEAAALAHQQELEHQRWEAEWNRDKGFQRWLDMLNGWRSMTKRYETEEKPL